MLLNIQYGGEGYLRGGVEGASCEEELLRIDVKSSEPLSKDRSTAHRFRHIRAELIDHAAGVTKRKCDGPAHPLTFRLNEHSVSSQLPEAVRESGIAPRVAAG